MTFTSSLDATSFADMPDNELNREVAQRMGLDFEYHGEVQIQTLEGPRVFSPVTCLEQASALIPRFGLNLRCLSLSRPGGRNEWGAWQGTEPVEDAEMVIAETPQRALVLAALSKTQLI
jgi:hypothetical protein